MSADARWHRSHDDIVRSKTINYEMDVSFRAAPACLCDGVAEECDFLAGLDEDVRKGGGGNQSEREGDGSAEKFHRAGFLRDEHAWEQAPSLHNRGDAMRRRGVFREARLRRRGK